MDYMQMQQGKMKLWRLDWAPSLFWFICGIKLMASNSEGYTLGRLLLVSLWH